MQVYDGAGIETHYVLMQVYEENRALELLFWKNIMF